MTFFVTEYAQNNKDSISYDKLLRGWKTAVAELFVKMKVVKKLWYLTNFPAAQHFKGAVSRVAIILKAITRSVFSDTAVPEYAQTDTCFAKARWIKFEC